MRPVAALALLIALPLAPAAAQTKFKPGPDVLRRIANEIAVGCQINAGQFGLEPWRAGEVVRVEMSPTLSKNQQACIAKAVPPFASYWSVPVEGIPGLASPVASAPQP